MIDPRFHRRLKPLPPCDEVGAGAKLGYGFVFVLNALGAVLAMRMFAVSILNLHNATAHFVVLVVSAFQAPIQLILCIAGLLMHAKTNIHRRRYPLIAIAVGAIALVVVNLVVSFLAMGFEVRRWL